ncbi:MAG TPA: pyrimidine dimer DNA glycosylase/endonuclease V [Spirochaetota bacterium]|nr:pyrimidine dimer DNA glycosylase/endonuclease V [Spirochaetota bacterium]HPI89565.1 pyrimidine dimer DNA glycosylase/endonuclease V [Spirochaetota bacterium]HPR49029.1 pyrimidine dimer DNA glycosylase/endonuclease V [Spirochaetota bacterium]
MRLWSLSPEYLDQKGLVALWRESLLAQKVLEGRTRGYKKHPQLTRFIRTKNPLASIGLYLKEIYNESVKRGYSFNEAKIKTIPADINPIPVTAGQINYEMALLKEKLKIRDKKKYAELGAETNPRTNNLFIVVEGGIEEWEKTKSNILKNI